MRRPLRKLAKIIYPIVCLEPLGNPGFLSHRRIGYCGEPPNRRSAVHFLDLESLEDRTVLSSITPTTFADGGAGSGSLRAAIIADNADPGTATDTITLQGQRTL